MQEKIENGEKFKQVKRRKEYISNRGIIFFPKKPLEFFFDNKNDRKIVLKKIKKHIINICINLNFI